MANTTTARRAPPPPVVTMGEPPPWHAVAAVPPSPSSYPLSSASSPLSPGPSAWASPPPSSRPVLFLLFAITSGTAIASSLASTSRVYLFEQSRCRLHYASADPTQIDSRQHVDERLCKIDAVQASVAMYMGIALFINAVCYHSTNHGPSGAALCVLAPYQKLLPVLGLRRLLVLNAICSAAAVAFSTGIFFLHQPWDAAVSLLSAVFTLVGGGDAVCSALLYTVIAQVCEPEHLSKTYYYQTALVHVSQVAGAAFGSFLLRRNVWLLNTCSALAFLTTAAIAMCVSVKQGLDQDLSNCGSDESGDQDDVPLPPPPREPAGQVGPPSSCPFHGFASLIQSSQSTLRVLMSSLKDRNTWNMVLSIFSMSRVPRLCTMLYFYLSVVWRIRSLFPQYTSTTLSWSLATVNEFLAFQDLLGWLVLLCLPTLRRFGLSHMQSMSSQDLVVVAICLACNVVGALGMSLFTVAIPFCISMSIYNMGQGVTDSLRSFGTQHLAKGETIREFYTHLSFALAVAQLIGSPIWSAAYSLLLATGASTAILFVALAAFLALAIMSTKALGTKGYANIDQNEVGT